MCTDKCKCENPCTVCDCESVDVAENVNQSDAVAAEPNVKMTEEEWLATQTPEVCEAHGRYKAKVKEIEDFRFVVSTGDRANEDMHLLRKINDLLVCWNGELGIGVVTADNILSEKISEYKKSKVRKEYEFAVDANFTFYLNTIFERNICANGVERASFYVMNSDRIHEYMIIFREAFSKLSKIYQEAGAIQEELSNLMSGISQEDIEKAEQEIMGGEAQETSIDVEDSSQLILEDIVTGERTYHRIVKFDAPCEEATSCENSNYAPDEPDEATMSMVAPE